MEGQARATTKRAGLNPWLANLIIGHRGVNFSTTAANSARSEALAVLGAALLQEHSARGSLVILHSMLGFMV